MKDPKETAKEERPRFHNAQVGDDVYCRLRGEGIIKSITYSERYPLECLFCDNCTPFDYNGRSQKDHFEPTLFYRKGEEKYLTERPEPEIDWSKVPMGTKVFVSDIINYFNSKDILNYPKKFMGYFHSLDYPFWVYDIKAADGYKYCKLAEPIKPEWIKK